MVTCFRWRRVSTIEPQGYQGEACRESFEKRRIRINMKLKFVAPLFVIFLHVGMAYGQRHEVGLLFGGMAASDQSFRPAGLATTGKLITSGAPTFQFNYGFRIFGGKIAAVYAEVPLVFAPNVDVEVSNAVLRNAPRSYSSFFITPGLKFKLFPTSFFAPYAAVGGGYARFNESETRIDNLPNAGQKGTNTGAFDFGGGVDIKLFHYLGLRGEVRDFITGRPAFNNSFQGTRQHNLVTSGGIVLRF